MIQQDSFSYLKGNTILFAQKMCDALNDMCNAQFLLQKESIREGAYSSRFTTAMFIHFTGTIQGYYLLSFNDDTVLRMIDLWEEHMPQSKIRDLRDEFGGFIKEALNLAVGQSIEELEKSFTDISFTPATIVYGEIEFPNILNSDIIIEGREGKMLCGFSLNLANLKIGEKLEETLHALEHQISEAQEAKRNISSILAVIPTGILTIDKKGTIQPGFSQATPRLVGRDPQEDIVGIYLPVLLGIPRDIHDTWSNWLTLTYRKYEDMPFDELQKLCPASEFTNAFNRILRLAWHPIPLADDCHLDKILVIIEDITNQRLLEQKTDDLLLRHAMNLDFIPQVTNLHPEEITDFLYNASALLTDTISIIEQHQTTTKRIKTIISACRDYKSHCKNEMPAAMKKTFRQIDYYSHGTDTPSTSRTSEQTSEYIQRIREFQHMVGSTAESIKEKALRDPQSVMVPLHDIDSAINQITNLVAECSSETDHEHICRALKNIQNVIAGHRTRGLSFFEVPFSLLTQNVSRKYGRKVSIVVVEDVEMDIVVLRKLQYSLVQLVLNAVIHGIESPDDRLQCGKVDVGEVALSGTKTDTSLCITVSDDGRGIDLDLLRSQLQTYYNYTREDAAAMTDEALFGILLDPGFISDKKHSNTFRNNSGLNMVNTTITEMGGTVMINSTEGKNTSVTIKIPLI